MLISASRRSDVPAFHTEWFLQALKEGSVTVTNPYNKKQQRQVLLDREAVTAFVFWTKNPQPFQPALARLDEAAYPYYFQFTLNNYPAIFEPGLPSLADRIKTLQELFCRLGPGRIVWRYDPIIFFPGFAAREHLANFRTLADQLAGLVRSCTFSFYQPYRKVARRMAAAGARLPDRAEKRQLIAQLARSGQKRGIRLSACCSELDYTDLGVGPAACIDPVLVREISGQELALAKDRHQRPGCNCAAAVDIGSYSTCRHGCLYCYAL